MLGILCLFSLLTCLILSIKLRQKDRLLRQTITASSTEARYPDAETEALETGAAETEAVETEAVETEAVETEAVETEAVETEAVETEAVETEAVETRAAETEAADPVIPQRLRIEKAFSPEADFLQIDVSEDAMTCSSDRAMVFCWLKQAPDGSWAPIDFALYSHGEPGPVMEEDACYSRLLLTPDALCCGVYRCDIYADEQKIHSAEFTVTLVPEAQQPIGESGGNGYE